MKIKRKALRSSQGIAVACASSVLFLAILVLIGWQFDILALTQILPGYITMKANTAIGLGFFATAQFYLALSRSSYSRKRILVSLFTGIAGLIAVVTLSEYFFDQNFGIDEFLYKDAMRIGARYPPGRLAPITAISFILIGLGVLFGFILKKRSYRFSQSLFFIVLLISIQAIVSYALGVQTSFGLAAYTRIAIHTAMAQALLSVGFLALSSEQGFVRVLFADSPNGISARRIIIAAVFVPPLVNVLESAGRNAGYYEADFGVLLRVIGSMVFFVFMVLRKSERLFLAEQETSEALMAVLHKEAERVRFQAEFEVAQERERSEAKFRAELIEARQRAEKAAGAKSEFLARMSHEIRTPLNGVIGIGDLLAHTPLNEKQAKYVETMQASGRALLTIINDILDFSKIEAGKVELEKARFNLPSMVQAQVELLRARASEKGLSVVLEIDSGIPSQVNGDSVRIGQVLLNLVSNAIKFTSEGEISIRLEALAFRRSGHGRVRFSVRDTGIGIPKEVQAKLFQAFSQGDISTMRKYGGTGLGLSISQSLVSLMGGQIGIESEVGQGSTFWFELEFEPAASFALEREPVKAMPLSQGTHWNNVLILVAEDNAVNQMVICEHLHDYGIETRIAENGLAAYTALKGKEKFDLIFMDCQMPEMDGYQATLKIRELEKTSGARVPIIALTANALSVDQEKCLAVGMDDYLSKPFDTKDLLAALRRWLPDKKRTERSSSVL